MSNADGGAAFPVSASEYGGNGTEYGMTLRAYFAAHAPFTLEDARRELVVMGIADPGNGKAMAFLAGLRMAYADEMIKASTE